MSLLRLEPLPLSPDFVRRLPVLLLAPTLRACFRPAVAADFESV